MAYQFTLTVEGPDLQSDAAINALFEAGCDDALVGRTDGVQYVEFDREANSLDEAVVQAIRAIETAVPGAHAVLVCAADA